MSYLSLNDMLKRDEIIDKNQNFINYYQIQGIKNTNQIKKVLVGTFEQSDIPLEKIYIIRQNNYTYSLYSHLISEEELNNEELTIIGFVITDKNNIICGFLNYIYNSNNKDTPFQIKFESETENIILYKYPVYQGNDKIIDILSIVLLEDVCKKFN